MNKIKQIKQLMNEWNAKAEKDTERGNESGIIWSGGTVNGLALALGILNEPSNTQMQIDAPVCKCSGCGKELTDPWCGKC
ncbi:MAG: hypothetical protein GY861_15410 [bacterium]|nr:hypothetical protein [bacterium]